jgi:hypothetical protein
MQPEHDVRARRRTLDPTEARQANPRKMNLRVLLVSLGLAAVLGAILVVGFWQTTPSEMDASSGGNPSQNEQPPADKPATP